MDSIVVVIGEPVILNKIQGCRKTNCQASGLQSTHVESTIPKIMYLNAESYPAHIDKIREFAATYEPDILLLSETRTTKRMKDEELELSTKYKMLRCDSENRRTGGVLIFIEKNMEYKVVENIHHLKNYWLITIGTIIKEVKYIISVIYHSPNSSDREFLSFVDEWFENNCNDSIKIVVGDFNLDWRSKELYATKLKNIVEINGVKQLTKDYTRITPRSKTLIDLVISNNYDTDCSVLTTPKISDHSIIQIDFPIQTVNFSQNQEYDYINYELLEQKLSNCEWNSQSRDINEMCDTFCNNIKKCVADSTEKFVVRDVKQINYNKVIDDCKKDPVFLWKTLKSIISTKNKAEIIFDNSVINGTNIDSNINSIAEIFEPINSHVLDRIPNSNSFLNNFKKITISDLEKIIFNTKNEYIATDLHISLIKNNFHILGNPLLDLVNMSLKNGVFPDKFKLVTITQIPKITGTSRVENLPPNVLPACGKVLEFVVHNQLSEYFCKNNFFTKEQLGFRRNHSCESAINFIVNEWKTSLNKNNIKCVIFLDLKRAFETVDREILLAKLNKYGICKVAYKWLSDYLKNRIGIIKNNKKTYYSCSDNGVPQVSVLGTLLFSIYINDMPYVISKCNTHLFADNTLLSYDSKEISDINKTVKFELNEIYNWMKVNKLKLDISKSKYMILCSKTLSLYQSLKENVDITIGNTTIELVEDIKYLGVIIDRRLKFDLHVQYICKKIAKKLNFLILICKYLSRNSRLVVYNTIIMPQFVYCSPIIFMCSKRDVDKLQKLQNRAMRIILDRHRNTRITDMLHELQWLKIKDYIEYKTLVYIYKIVNGLCPDYLSSNIKRNKDIHRYQTRQANLYSVARASIFYNGIKVFNKLPKNIRDVDNMNIFKTELKNEKLSIIS